MIIQYYPDDLAKFLLHNNFTHAVENEIIRRFHATYLKWLEPEYKDDLLQFKARTYDCIYRYDYSVDWDELSLIYADLGINETPDENQENEAVYFYFKQIHLKLLFSDVAYKRIKLRTLLKAFRYERRSEKLLAKMNQAMTELGILSYIKGNRSCHLSEISIDDMVIFRLSFDLANLRFIVGEGKLSKA